ncbi:porin family protein [Bacteroidota bacterium]
MKKLFFLTIIAMFLFTSANAQIFQYGLKAGVNFSKLAMDDITGISSATGAYDLVTGESVTGYQLGVMTRVNVAMVFIQPEVYFNALGGTVQKVATGGATELLDVKFNRIDIPLLVGVKFGPARINIGPVGSAVISSTNELVDLAEAGTTTLSDNFTWGFQAGIGLDLFNKLALDARYESSLSRFGESFEIAGTSYPLDARPNSWIIALGYWF